jgi:membrane associated rhomboid family serine protease
MYGSTSIWQDIRHQYDYGGAHVKLIIINVAVFIAANLLLLFGDLLMQGTYGSKFLLWFMPVADVGALIKKPWSVFTYMFLHERFFHILFNMLFLYWFGNVLKDLIGNAKIVPVYIYGGLAGVFLFILAYNIFPAFSGQLMTPILGASAGVMAIVWAAATIAPNYTFFLILLGPVKIKWIAVFYVVMDLVQMRHGNPGGHLAHLGGALIGYLFILQLQRGNDWGKPFYYLEDMITHWRNPIPKIKVVHKKEKKVKATTAAGGSSKMSTQMRTSSKQEELDSILDKISRSGYDSLSPEEKAFLFKVSQED